MARGYGWRCDNCGETVITEPQMSYNQRPPRGWFVVYRDVDAREESVAPSQEWHLCSHRCLSEWARRVASP